MSGIFAIQERSVVHFNVADFAVAIERAEDCSLKEKPLVIAPTGAARAVVHDMSEEAYGDGVRKNMPLKMALGRCPRAVVMAPRIGIYQKAMARFARELQRFSPLIESGQADGHFFVDLTGTHRLHGPAPDVGWRVRREMRKYFGLDPIWSLATNKLVAKVASRLVKPVGEYIVAPGDEMMFLAPLAITLLPGISREERQKMSEFGLTTMGALAALSHSQLMVPFGRRADAIYAACRGIDDSRVCEPPSINASVAVEHFFADDTNDLRQLEAVITALGSRVGRILRGNRQVARRVGVWLRYCDGAQVVRQATLRNGTSGDFMLHKLAVKALRRAWIRRTRIRSCRLLCDRLQRQSPQLSLFSSPTAQDHRHTQVLEAMDSLRDRYGEMIIGTGRQYQA